MIRVSIVAVIAVGLVGIGMYYIGVRAGISKAIEIAERERFEGADILVERLQWHLAPRKQW